MKAVKTPKTLKEMSYPKQKRLLKRSNTPAKTNAPISETSSDSLKLTIQTYKMTNKELKMKLGQLQEEI